MAKLEKEISAGFNTLADNWVYKIPLLANALRNPVLHQLLAEMEENDGWILSSPPPHGCTTQVTDGKEVAVATYLSNTNKPPGTWNNFVPKGLKVRAWKYLSLPPVLEEEIKQ